MQLLKKILVFLLLWAGIALAATAADPAKVLRVPFEAADSGFDSILSANAYSGRVAEAIFERLLTYDYLARPTKLVPQTAVAMPDIGNAGKC